MLSGCRIFPVTNVSKGSPETSSTSSSRQVVPTRVSELGAMDEGPRIIRGRERPPPPAEQGATDKPGGPHYDQQQRHASPFTISVLELH